MRRERLGSLEVNHQLVLGRAASLITTQETRGEDDPAQGFNGGCFTVHRKKPYLYLTYITGNIITCYHPSAIDSGFSVQRANLT